MKSSIMWNIIFRCKDLLDWNYNSLWIILLSTSSQLIIPSIFCTNFEIFCNMIFWNQSQLKNQYHISELWSKIERIKQLYVKQKHDPPIRQNLQPVASNAKCPRRLLKQIEEPMKKIRLTRHEISCFTAECKPHGLKLKIKLSLFEILIVVLFIIFIFYDIFFISYSKIEML